MSHIYWFILLIAISRCSSQDTITPSSVIPAQDTPTETKSTTEGVTEENLYVQEFIECVEEGQCGIMSVCSFKFDRVHSFNYDHKANKITHVKGTSLNHLKVDELSECPNNEESEDGSIPPEQTDAWLNILRKSKSKSDKTKTLPPNGVCKRTTEGHLFSISNKITSPLNFYWDVLDTFTTSTNVKADGAVFVPAGSTRYFLDTIYKTHTVRLVIGDQIVTETIARSQSKCKEEDACDLLYRLCYQYNEDQKRYSDYMDETTIDKDLEYYCSIYTSECDHYASKKIDREQCVTNCLKTYWPETLKNVEKEVQRINSPMDVWMKKKGFNKKNDNKPSDSTTVIPSSYVMDCLIQSPEYKQFKETKNTLSSITVESTTSSSAWAAITILIIIAVVALILLACWVPYWGENGALTTVQYIRNYGRVKKIPKQSESDNVLYQ